MLLRREFGMADLLCGGVGRRLTLLERRAQALRALCSTHEKKLYFAGAGRVRVIVRAAARRRRRPFAAAGHGRNSGTHLFWANGSGDSGGAGAGARAAGASAGIFAGSRGAVVADLVPFGGLQIRDELAAAPWKSDGRPGLPGCSGQGRGTSGCGVGETRI